MIHWKQICGSRCAIDSMYDWLDDRLSTKDLINILIGLGYKNDVKVIRKYIIKHKTGLLINNMRRGLKRNE